ncbi:unnamed protein product, partial [Brassica oleracea]
MLVPWIIPSLLKTDKPIMASCGTGVTACILTLGFTGWEKLRCHCTMDRG